MRIIHYKCTTDIMSQIEKSNFKKRTAFFLFLLFKKMNIFRTKITEFVFSIFLYRGKIEFSYFDYKSCQVIPLIDSQETRLF